LFKDSTLVGFFVIGLLIFSHQQVAFGQMGKNLEVKILSGSADNKIPNAFYPDILPMDPGDTITWVNEDSAAHSITSGVPKAPEYSGLFFKTGNIDAQKSESVQITDLENRFAFYYFCEIHPWMTGKIVISTAPESQPDTALPIAIGQNTYSKGQDISVTGKVADDYAKISYQILIYDQSRLVDSIEGHFNDDATLDETIPTDKLDGAKYTLKLVYGLPTQIASTSFDLKSPPEHKIPGWIKEEAKLWSSDAISDGEFIDAIQYLSKENIIDSQITSEPGAIPGWIKTNVSWWADGLTSDTEFADALEYLVNAKIIQI
jgi:plastocyanin